MLWFGFPDIGSVFPSRPRAGLLSRWLLSAIFGLLLAMPLLPDGLQNWTPPVFAQTSDAGTNPVFDAPSDSAIWREIRSGKAVLSTSGGGSSGPLVQVSGEDWMRWREIWIFKAGVIGVLGTVVLLSAVYMVFGSIPAPGGTSFVQVHRFTGWERSLHWMLAVSFLVLAGTGANIVIGKAWLLPHFGGEAFSIILLGGKLVHNAVAFSFMVSLSAVIVIWIRDNMPRWYDVVWLARLGGLLGVGHPPAGRFNAGQKLIFWFSLFAGVGISLTGMSLLFPGQLTFVQPVFDFLRSAGVPAPEVRFAIQEMQWAQLLHGGIAVAFIVVILAHIYIGTVGIKGAFSAMARGFVDRNWALAHHSRWRWSGRTDNGR